MYDDDIVRNFTRLLARQGLKIETGAKVTGFKSDVGGVPSPRSGILTAERDGKKLEFPADKVLVAVGRRPYTDGLGLDRAGVQLDEKKRVKVDAHLRTNVPGIWAIGDVVAGPMLAHKAEDEGVAVVETIAGQHGHVDLDTIPWVVYTSPEIAWVGRTEQQLKQSGQAYRAGTFPFAANGRARALGDTNGMVKCLADANTDRVLGVHIIGPMASELIAEAVLAMAFQASSEDIARVCHAHPSLSEATKEAALAVDGRALNY